MLCTESKYLSVEFSVYVIKVFSAQLPKILVINVRCILKLYTGFSLYIRMIIWNGVPKIIVQYVKSSKVFGALDVQSEKIVVNAGIKVSLF